MNSAIITFIKYAATPFNFSWCQEICIIKNKNKQYLNIPNSLCSAALQINKLIFPNYKFRLKIIFSDNLQLQIKKNISF